MFKTLISCFVLLPILVFLSCKKQDTLSNSPIDVDLALNWKSSGPYTSSPYEPPIDVNGNSWEKKAYLDDTWTSNISIPDKNWGCSQCDKYYRSSFQVNSGELSSLNFTIKTQTDDGNWVYINDNLLGHYGGNLHQSGCVNMTEWYCASNANVGQLRINELLTEGLNNVSVHVSEAYDSEYFKIVVNKKN
ncbi:MAG: hypothetical protein K1X86_00370 [Ignavibacteria bacterium]|nr:hypothetical protein [Ignavibacteria bacterium]